jgi:hypothetical integral membrane protein (TIGR02206 family)
MTLFGPLHLVLIASILLMAAGLAWLCRTGRVQATPLRVTIGLVTIGNELVWLWFRYSHEGVHVTNLPLQLCDVTLWMSALACLAPVAGMVEFAYFAGLAGAGMAILQPDLWSPWPSYPAIYFFVAHAAIVIAVCVLVFGGIAPLRAGAPWRAFGWLLAYACMLGMVNAATGANYMYLRQKPNGASLLNQMGPWPWYLLPAAVVGLAVFWLLWLPARPAVTARTSPAA